MSRIPHQRFSSGTRPRPKRMPAGLLAAALVVFGVCVLFLMAWQSHQMHQLQRDRTRLSRDVSHGEDQVRRLYVQWYGATRREVIVDRAKRELDLVEPDLDDRLVVALGSNPVDSDMPQWFRRIRNGLDRYGEIRGALAGEGDR